MNNTAINEEIQERNQIMIAAQELVLKRIEAGDRVMQLSYDFTPYTDNKAVAALAYSVTFSYATNNVGRASYSMLKKLLQQAFESSSEVV